MLRGRPRAMKLSTKDLTDFSEQRSSFIISTRADSFSWSMSFLASFADSMFLAATMTWAFLRAKTLAVSKPIPLAPPAFVFQCLVKIWTAHKTTDKVVGRKLETQFQSVNHCTKLNKIKAKTDLTPAPTWFFIFLGGWKSTWIFDFIEERKHRGNA